MLDRPPKRTPAGPPPMEWFGTVVLFSGAGVLLFCVTHWLMPALATRTTTEPVILWFAAAGSGVFVPLLFATIVLLRMEDVCGEHTVWRNRLRFRPMTGSDWLWSLCGLAVIGVLAAGCVMVLRNLCAGVRLHPSFISMTPLTADRYWIMGVWLPFWIVNIMSEEILWRGVVLPRQEVAFGKWAWLVNGAGWLFFHFSFGPAILLTLVPTTFIVPYVVQRQQNSWTGVVIHAGLNGPGFIAVAFGIV